jgi:hypothetical protein
MAEIQLLRESLKRAHEDLDQAQRLNQSLVSRQVHKLLFLTLIINELYNFTGFSRKTPAIITVSKETRT